MQRVVYLTMTALMACIAVGALGVSTAQANDRPMAGRDFSRNDNKLRARPAGRQALQRRLRATARATKQKRQRTNKTIAISGDYGLMPGI